MIQVSEWRCIIIFQFVITIDSIVSEWKLYQIASKKEFVFAIKIGLQKIMFPHCL
jgi:hypothetical protein